MKHIFLIAIIIGLGILTRAETEYEVSGNGSSKVLKGLISRDLLSGDTAFKWFSENQKGYTPPPGEVAVLAAKGIQVRFLVFGGTWSPDTRYLLPKFFSLLDAASIPGKQVTLIGVDRDKHAADHLAEDLHITRLPTFIVLKDGKEIGRVEELGKTGQWEKEIAGIVSGSN
ncbi:thioredoxin family protein [Flavitalea flava]